jgi:hypothetical protein
MSLGFFPCWRWCVVWERNGGESRLFTRWGNIFVFDVKCCCSISWYCIGYLKCSVSLIAVVRCFCGIDGMFWRYPQCIVLLVLISDFCFDCCFLSVIVMLPLLISNYTFTCVVCHAHTLLLEVASSSSLFVQDMIGDLRVWWAVMACNHQAYGLESRNIRIKK